MTIKFENIYECEKISSNLKTFMKKYEYENIYEYEKISSNLLFENIYFGFLVASNNFLENIYEYEKISSNLKKNHEFKKCP